VITYENPPAGHSPPIKVTTTGSVPPDQTLCFYVQTYCLSCAAKDYRETDCETAHREWDGSLRPLTYINRVKRRFSRSTPMHGESHADHRRFCIRADTRLISAGGGCIVARRPRQFLP
jgi:hypothetical protein